MMKYRFLLLLLVFIPLVAYAKARTVHLAVGDTLTVVCPGQLMGTIGQQQAEMVCNAAATPTTTPTATPIPPTPTPSGPQAWAFTFDGDPAGPQAWQPADWANVVHSRDRSSWTTLPLMHAGHGTDCAAPPATHETSTYPDAIFLCRDHVMTAIDGSAGYAAVYLQPPVMVDFAEEAVIAFDVSTLRTSNRDWIDLWVTPFDEQLAAPLDAWLPDLQGDPRRAIHIRMDMSSGKTTFRAKTVSAFTVTDLGTAWWLGYEDVLIPSAISRDTFELRLSPTHLTFSLPAYGLTWLDADIPALDWTRGIVQLGQHSYTPFKDCDPSSSQCGPNTWHWDNLSISRAVPYTVQRVGAGLLDATNPGAALPAGGGHLRFLGYGDALELSFDGGQTWEIAQRQQQSKADLGHFATYWHPIPAGATAVQFRSLVSCWCGDWAARDLYVIAG